MKKFSCHDMRFRETSPADADDVLRVHRLAFGQDEEALLVERLLRDPSARPYLSLLAEKGGEIAGHVLFTALDLSGFRNAADCSLLAPLAVLPAFQRSGVGQGLIEHGCEVLAERGIALVFVLGDPDYYTRCGFTPAYPHGLHAPYVIEPEEAWMVRPLRPDVLGHVQGQARCAEALAAEKYWRE
jgi:putative acetyltransferase